MEGRRLEDVPIGDLPKGDIQQGDYWKLLDREGGDPLEAWDAPDNLTGTVWQVCAPNVGGVATLVKHTVREHDDGTISVRAGDGSSNSILVSNGKGSYHGYIEHGVWTSV